MIERILTILDQPGSGYDMMGIFGNGWWMWMMLMMIGGMILGSLLAIWTYQDAQKHGENALLWALIVFFTMGFGIILYVLIRNPNRPPLTTNAYSSQPQPSQSKSKTVMYSPQTQYEDKPGSSIKGGFCDNCKTPLELDAIFCPNCGKAVGSA